MSNHTRSLPLLLVGMTALGLAAAAASAAAQDPQPQQELSTQQPARDQDLDRATSGDEQSESRHGDLMQEDSSGRASDDSEATSNPSEQSESTADEPSPAESTQSTRTESHENESMENESVQTQSRSAAPEAVEPVEPPNQVPRDTMREPESMRHTESTTTTVEPAAEPNAVTAGVQAKFDALDTDHDGTIDRTEAAASEVLSSQFSALDTKGDGRLTIDEFAAASDIALIRNEHRDTEQQE